MRPNCKLRETNFNAQHMQHPIAINLRRQIRCLSSGLVLDKILRWNPIDPIVHWYFSRQLNKFIGSEFDSYISELRGGKRKATKSIISLLAQQYVKETSLRASILDNSFKSLAVSQIKQLLFSGHETSGSSLCYILYLLSKNRGVLRCLRKEHEAIFGTDREERIQKLSESPNILHQLPYSTAVCKEMLRLFPFGSSLRAGEPGYFVQDADGTRNFPTEECI